MNFDASPIAKTAHRAETEMPHGAASRGGALKWFLLALGTIDLLALVAAAMPEEWMAGVHRQLGLGELPATPLMGYLTRSASLLYGLHGAMIVFLAFDTARYRPLIRFLAWAAVLHGLLLFLVDWWEGLPLWWTLLEGPAYGLIGLAVVGLVNREARLAGEDRTGWDG